MWNAGCWLPRTTVLLGGIKMLGVEFAERPEQAAGIQFEIVGWTSCLHDAWLWNTFIVVGTNPEDTGGTVRGAWASCSMRRRNRSGSCRLQHYADWLEQHPTTFIRSKERLDEK